MSPWNWFHVIDGYHSVSFNVQDKLSIKLYYSQIGYIESKLYKQAITKSFKNVRKQEVGHKQIRQRFIFIVQFEMFKFIDFL